MSVAQTIIITTDQHDADIDGGGVPYRIIPTPIGAGFWFYGGVHYRWWKNAVATQTAAAALATSATANLLADLGDMVDNAGTINHATRLTEMVVQRNTFAGNRLNVLGNHEYAHWSADFTDYYTVVNSGHVTKANICPVNAHAWTVDISGIRYVAIGDLIVAAMSAGELTWLSDTALDTALPVVVLSHKRYTNSGASTFGCYTNFEDIRAIFEAAGNVQVVITGHDHLANGGYQWLNDILYLHLYGQVVGPSDGTTPDATYKTYFQIDLTTDAYMGAVRLRCNAEVTAYGYGTSKTGLSVITTIGQYIDLEPKKAGVLTMDAYNDVTDVLTLNT